MARGHVEMKRKRLAIAAFVILALLVLVVVVLFMIGVSPFNSERIEVSNVSLDLGVQSATVNYGVMPPSVNYTVKNLSSIEIVAVSVSIDGVSHAQTSLSVPSEHMVSTTTFLSDIALSPSTDYSIRFGFTFADGTSETCSTSCRTP